MRCRSTLFAIWSAIALVVAVFPSSVKGQPVEQTATGFYWPTGTSSLGNLAGWLADSCSWSGNQDYIDGFFHTGWDIAANEGDPVYAIADGEVVLLSTQGWGVGNIAVLVEHQLADKTKFIAVYGHVQSSLTVGKRVEAGQSLATIGPFSPPHLHFGVRPGIALTSPFGRMPCPEEGPITDTNGFVDPISWIQTHTPRAIDIVGIASGIFINFEPASALVSGVGTDFFSWGDPADFGTGPSSLEFTGAEFVTGAEEVFTFGSLTFFNGLSATGETISVDLKVTMILTMPPEVTHQFIRTLTLINTLNTEDPIESADIILLRPSFSSFIFAEGDSRFRFRFRDMGFGDVTGGGFASKDSFTVLEGESATVELLGIIVKPIAMPWLKLLLLDD